MKFLRLMYGDTEIDPSNYTIKHGSTIITLNEAHLKTYAKGTHWFVAEFSDGTSERIRLNVSPALAAGEDGALPTTGQTPTTGNQTSGNLPTTGDIGKPIDLIIALVALMLYGLMFFVISRRRKVTE